MVMGKSQNGVQLREASGSLTAAEVLVPIRNVDSYNRAAIMIRQTGNLTLAAGEEVSFIISTSYDAQAGIYADSTTNTDGAVDIAQSVIAVVDGSVFVVGDVVRMDDEKMLVTAIATDDLTVTRAFEGTAAATHITALDVFLLQATWVDLALLNYDNADDASAPVAMIVIGDDVVPVVLDDVTATLADDTVRVLPFSDRIRLSTTIANTPAYTYEAYASFYHE